MTRSWYERRAFLIEAAKTEPGWGCVTIVRETHIGRVVMFRRYLNLPAGFYPNGATCRLLDSRYAADQKSRTAELPK